MAFSWRFDCKTRRADRLAWLVGRPIFCRRRKPVFPDLYFQPLVAIRRGVVGEFPKTSSPPRKPTGPPCIFRRAPVFRRGAIAKFLNGVSVDRNHFIALYSQLRVALSAPRHRALWKTDFRPRRITSSYITFLLPVVIIGLAAGCHVSDRSAKVDNGSVLRTLQLGFVETSFSTSASASFGKNVNGRWLVY